MIKFTRKEYEEAKAYQRGSYTTFHAPNFLIDLTRERLTPASNIFGEISPEQIRMTCRIVMTEYEKTLSQKGR